MIHVMRTAVVALVLVMAATWASADSGSDAGSGSADSPAAGSAVSPAGSAAGSALGSDAAAALRKTCADAMNANPGFATDIVTIVDRTQHDDAARAIATNERHVIVAYAAMWLASVAFLVFLSRRQIALRREIESLRRDLDAAIKENA